MRYADPVLDAEAYEARQYMLQEHFEKWQESNCKCDSCKVEMAAFKYDGLLYCQECFDKDFLIEGVEYADNGKTIEESDYYYGTDEMWMDFVA